MSGQTFSGIEITVYNADQTISCQPSYEAHTVAKAVEIINHTKQMLQPGQTMTHRVY
jgi:hypothetical protein